MHAGNEVYNNTDAQRGFYRSIYGGSRRLNNINLSAFRSGFELPNFLSDYYLEKATFFRMDNITLAYNFNKLFTNRINAT